MSQSSWFSCSPKKQDEGVVEPIPAGNASQEKTANEEAVDSKGLAKAQPAPERSPEANAAPADPKTSKAEKKKREAEAKAKLEQEKREKKEAEKEAKRLAKENKDKDKRDTEAKKKADKEQKVAAKVADKASPLGASPANVNSEQSTEEPKKETDAKRMEHAEVLSTDSKAHLSPEQAPEANVPVAQDDKTHTPIETEKEKPTIMKSIASIFKKKDDPREDAADDVKEAAKANPDHTIPDSQKIVFVLGGPGSGKGTQCLKIKERYSFDHISAGDLLRNEVAQNTDQGKTIGEMIKNGQIVPVEVTLTLLRAELERRKSSKGFLIDGFPRQIDQAIAFEAALRSPDLILFFECPESILEGRLLKRGETSGRMDDNAESIKRRFQVFADISSKCIEHYEQEGKVKLLKIDASGEEGAVWDAVQKGFSEHGIH